MSTTRNTIQRQLVLQAVQNLHHHPTAEDIYTHVAQSHPGISKATVYRNLSLLADSGEIQRVSHLNAADRFDFELKPHYHFRCHGCNCVFDVELPYMADIIEQMPKSPGFEYHSHEVTFTGLCPNCAEQPVQNQKRVEDKQN